jgi:hypothetical protein
MPFWMSNICDRLMAVWLTASPGDFGRVSMVVVVFGWLMTRTQR